MKVKLTAVVDDGDNEVTASIEADDFESAVRGVRGVLRTCLVQNARGAAPPGDDLREFGTVKKWFTSRGFGFLTADTGGLDVYVHASSLPKGVLVLEDGDRVSFVAMTTKAGIQGVRVKVVETQSQEAAA